MSGRDPVGAFGPTRLVCGSCSRQVSPRYVSRIRISRTDDGAQAAARLLRPRCRGRLRVQGLGDAGQADSLRRQLVDPPNDAASGSLMRRMTCERLPSSADHLDVVVAEDAAASDVARLAFRCIAS